MNVECPSCKLENEIEHLDNIMCSSCKEPFHGHSYKKTKSTFIATCSALAIGAYGSYKADQLYFDKERYPVNIEYELIDSCVNSSSRILRRTQYIEKKLVCSCALEKTMLEINYIELEKKRVKIFDSFYS